MPSTYQTLIRISLYISLVTLTPISYSANNLPSLGGSGSSIISIDTEYSLGQGLIRQIRGSNTLLEDPIVESYLTDLVWDLVPNSQLQDKRISLAVIDNQNINAFAAPGGIIGLNTGLILAAKREDEVASVISHELAHLSQRHFASLLARNKSSTPYTIASILGGLLIASVNPEAGSAVLIGGAAKSQISALAFSRRNEQEADRIGMNTLINADYDPNAMPRMFERLLEKQRLQGSNPPEFLLTHPTSTARIADTKNRARKLGFGKKGQDPLEFKIIKTRLQVKYYRTAQSAVSRYSTAVKKDPSSANYYALALALSAANSPKKAIPLFAKLSPSWRNHLYIQLSLAQILQQNKQWQKANNLLTKLDKNYPQHIAVQRVLAKILFEDQQYPKAVEILTEIIDYAPEDITAWYYLSEAYGKLEQRHATHRSRINYFLLRGQVNAAKRQITFARRERSIKRNDISQLDQLDIQLKKVKAYLNTRY